MNAPEHDPAPRSRDHWEELSADNMPPPAPSPASTEGKPAERASAGTVEIDPETVARVLSLGRKA